MKKQTRREFIKRSSAAAAGLGAMSLFPAFAERKSSPAKPNILLALSDDQSWLHTGASGDANALTPVFDRVAREGVRFTHAYSPAPTCGPSRAGILTGQEVWRLGEAANQNGPLALEHEVYTEILEDAGYHVGYGNKGWHPGEYRWSRRTQNPAGKQYGNTNSDSIKSFRRFLDALPEDKPFCYWFGSLDPHRDYDFKAPARMNLREGDVFVPPLWPDVREVRRDIAAYLWEIKCFDRDVGRMLNMIEKTGRLDNTLVVITSDNGMPFPRAKNNLYDLGTRMPLAICWRNGIPGGRVVDDFVSLTDLAPTFLEAAGIDVPEKMTGMSLMKLLTSRKSGCTQKHRDMVVTARERHSYVRPGGVGYPSRAIRTFDYLYIRNYEPDRWPAGDPPFFGDTDNWELAYYAPTKEYMMVHRDDPQVRPLFELSFGKRPGEELYDVRSDPYQMNNLLISSPGSAGPANSDIEKIREQLASRLDDYLKKTGDPRALGREVIWDTAPYRARKEPRPRRGAPLPGK